MRILHTADWHLGKQLHHRSLIEDQAYILEQFHALLKDERPDAVLIAGDVFDRAIPSADAVQLFDETLHRLALDFKRPVIIISGNHDSEVRLRFGSRLFERSNIFIFGGLETSRSSLTLEDSHGKVRFLAVPYLEAAVARELLHIEDCHSHEDALRAALSLHVPVSRSVVIAHAFVQGGLSSDSERPLSLGGADLISADVFAGYSYVALGHLHRPQSVLPSIRYAGSLLKYSSSEVTHRKSVSLVDIDHSGTASLAEIQLTPRRDFRELRGRLSDLLHEDFDTGDINDYFFFVLEDTGAVLDAMPRLRERYPNALDLKRLYLEGGSNAEYRGPGDHLKREALDLFTDFAGQVSNVELSEAHIDILQSVCRLHEGEADE